MKTQQTVKSIAAAAVAIAALAGVSTAQAQTVSSNAPAAKSLVTKVQGILGCRAATICGFKVPGANTQRILGCRAATICGLKVPGAKSRTANVRVLGGWS
jgi:hypothetical protein